MVTFLRNGKTIAPESNQTCVLYDQKSGRIVHLHQEITYPGGRKLTKSEAESRALEAVAKVRGNAAGLKVLHVSPEQLQPPKIYKVDVKARRLVEQPLPKKLQGHMSKLRRGSTVKRK
jgi:hypothetical protein